MKSEFIADIRGLGWLVNRKWNKLYSIFAISVTVLILSGYGEYELKHKMIKWSICNYANYGLKDENLICI